MSGNAQKPQSGKVAAEGSWSVGATGSGKSQVSGLLPRISGDVVSVRDLRGSWIQVLDVQGCRVVDLSRRKGEPIYLDPLAWQLGSPTHGLSIPGDRGAGYGPSGDES